MKQYSISNLYTLEETIAAELFEGKEYPWEVEIVGGSTGEGGDFKIYFKTW